MQRSDFLDAANGDARQLAAVAMERGKERELALDGALTPVAGVLPAAVAALGQGRATAAAMESIGRNPNSADKIQTPLIIDLALMEALTLYALVIAFFLQGKIQ